MRKKDFKYFLIRNIFSTQIEELGNAYFKIPEDDNFPLRVLSPELVDCKILFISVFDKNILLTVHSKTRKEDYMLDFNFNIIKA